MQVELVHTTTLDQVPLDGYLRVPSSTAARGPIDAVICHHGVGGKFYTPSFFDVAGDALLEQGCAVLRVNNRGHDDAFLVGQREYGASYEIVDECRHDITAWLDFAESRGYRRVAVWGHSLGAVKTVYFLSVQDDDRIVCAVASSPPRFSHAMYAASAGDAFQSAIRDAQKLVDDGVPEQLVQARVPMQRSFAARTYLDKYGSTARYDYMQHLPNIRKPLLLTVGSLEAGDVSFASLVQDGPAFNTRWSDVECQVVDGADHSYTERTRELWSTVGSWLARATGALSAAR